MKIVLHYDILPDDMILISYGGRPRYVTSVNKATALAIAEIMTLLVDSNPIIGNLALQSATPTTHYLAGHSGRTIG